MTPEYVRSIRKAANLVQDEVNTALRMDTDRSRQVAEWAIAEFAKRYPNYRWQDWCEKDTVRTR